MGLLQNAYNREKERDEAVTSCLEYILEIELDDFLTNPSKIHVYYFAYLALFGKQAATEFLDDAIENAKDSPE